MEKTVSAILLAGGFSSRMGRDKAELDFCGKPLIRYQAERLRALGIRDLVIAGYPKPVAGARFAPDIYPHRGPLSGLHAGLLAVENPRALLLAVDTPLVPEDLLRALIEAHRGGITLAAIREEPEPLIGVYDRSLARECEAVLQGERTSMRRLFDRVKPALVPYRGDPLLLLNCNTPEEYRRLCEYKAGRRAAEAKGSGRQNTQQEAEP